MSSIDPSDQEQPQPTGTNEPAPAPGGMDQQRLDARYARAQAKAEARQRKVDAKQAKASGSASDSAESVLKKDITFRRKPKQQPAGPGAGQGASVVVTEGGPGASGASGARQLPAGKSPVKQGRGVQRSIRPIRSRSQQTTSRLIWAVFGMALVIVSVVGFWVVLNAANEEEPDISEVFVTTRALEPGDLLESDALRVESIEVGELSHVLASQLNDVLGRRVVASVGSDELLTLGVLGEVPNTAELENEYLFDVALASGATVPEGLVAGDRVVVLIRVDENPDQLYALEVIDVFEVAESGVSIKISFEERAWWEEVLDNYNRLDGISMEFEVVDIAQNRQCWLERYRIVHQINHLQRDDFEDFLEQRDCPEEWLAEVDSRGLLIYNCHGQSSLQPEDLVERYNQRHVPEPLERLLAEVEGNGPPAQYSECPEESSGGGNQTGGETEAATSGTPSEEDDAGAGENVSGANNVLSSGGNLNFAAASSS